MSKVGNIILAAKCAPEQGLLENIKRAGLRAVELYLSGERLKKLKEIIRTCKTFPLEYAVHANNDSFRITELAELVGAIDSRIIVLHNIYWEDEWEEIMRVFGTVKTKICIENTLSPHEPLKYMRRYKVGRCLDLEHLQMQCSGVYEEEFIRVMKQASHIHLTGYKHGSDLWHTHLHHNPGHSIYLLDLIQRSGYSGFVISEARLSLQTYAEFKGLKDFFEEWKSRSLKEARKNSK